MRSKITYIILAGLFFLCVLFYCLFSYRKAASFRLPPETVGNTAGNIRGRGMFCEYDGKVYFSNAYDNGALYVMNPDCTDIKRLSPASASFINAGGNYLFYYTEGTKGGVGLGYVRSMTGIYRCTLQGKDFKCLSDDLATMAVLSGDSIYYQHYDNTNFSSFNKLSIDDSKTDELLQKKSIIETACVDNGTLYYSGTEKDHYVYGYDLTSGSTRTIWQGNTCYPTIIGSYIYYLDVDNNYQLCCYDSANDTITVLTHDRVDFYNIYDQVIFYQKNDKNSPALIRMSIDGSNPEVVAEGVYNRINTTSTYTYFYPFDEDAIVYRTSTFGPISVDSFPEALNAALDNQ